MTIAARLVEPTRTDSAKTATSMVGSTSASDGDLPARAHPAERGAGVQPGQGQRDRAQHSSADHGEQVGRRSSGDAVVTNGATAATTSEVVDQHAAARARNTSLGAVAA